MSRYINPYTDFGFKKLFGSELNKDLLIGFLNALLEEAKQLPDDEIIDLKYLNSEQLGRTKYDRKAVFDVLCQTEKGAKFHVEMQNVFQEFFIDRTIYYSTFPIQDMAKKDSVEEGRWNFELQRLYSVNILNFTFNDKNNDNKQNVNEISDDDLLHCVMLKNIKTNKIFSDKLVFIYLEMPKFNKTIEECKTFYDKWLFVLSNLTNLMERPKELQERVFKRLFEQAEIATFTIDEYNAYEESLKNYLDIANGMVAAEKRGVEKGRAEGIVTGEKQAKLAIACTLKSLGKMTIEEIAVATKLTVDEISKI